MRSAGDGPSSRLLDELPLAALATHTFPFEAAGDGFAAIDAGTPGLIHAAFGYE